jgi:hypothetical protein
MPAIPPDEPYRRRHPPRNLTHMDPEERSNRLTDFWFGVNLLAAIGLGAWIVTVGYNLSNDPLYDPPDPILALVAVGALILSSLTVAIYTRYVRHEEVINELRALRKELRASQAGE